MPFFLILKLSVNCLPGKGLTNLSITNTGLSSISLEDLTDLTHLDLRNNSLSSLTFTPAINIQQLYLSGNDWSCFTEEAEDLDSLIFSRCGFYLQDLTDLKI